jgi:hypothetical protein
MSIRPIFVFAAAACSGLCGIALSQPSTPEVVRYRSAVVALTEDAELRKTFEDSLVAKARTDGYDAVTSYDVEPDVGNLDRDRFLRALPSGGVQAVLMLRPAAIGAGSSLQSVRNAVSPELFRDMQEFAQAVSPSGGENLIAVVHMAIYVLSDDDPELISAGAVWLDEAVGSQAEGIDRLQDLMLANVDAVRPAIREHLGLAPLP